MREVSDEVSRPVWLAESCCIGLGAFALTLGVVGLVQSTNGAGIWVSALGLSSAPLILERGRLRHRPSVVLSARRQLERYYSAAVAVGVLGAASLWLALRLASVSATHLSWAVGPWVCALLAMAFVLHRRMSSLVTQLPPRPPHRYGFDGDAS